MKLPKQSQPIIRLHIAAQSYTQSGQLMPAGVDDCYKLSGPARQMCVQGYIR